VSVIASVIPTHALCSVHPALKYPSLVIVLGKVRAALVAALRLSYNMFIPDDFMVKSTLAKTGDNHGSYNFFRSS
jgi:hypothetical protein